MTIEKSQIFNLMDTNGRRSDVLNALKTYLEILEELEDGYPKEGWGTYPNSRAQFLFYQKALEKSKDVFKIHSKYDAFIHELGAGYSCFIARDPDWIHKNLPKYGKILDEAIEKRSRHYTSTLVKMGFTSAQRTITEAGYSYVRGSVARDPLEELLPLDNINIALLRQLAKLRIFSTPDDEGKRQYYSPFFMALSLLLDGETIDKSAFETIVQGLTPYSSEALKHAVSNHSVSVSELEKAVRDIAIPLPEQLVGKTDLEYDEFKGLFKGSKSNASTSQAYYDFYHALKKFRVNPNSNHYAGLLKCFESNASMLNKAFGYGKPVFHMGNKGSRLSLKQFIAKNRAHPFIDSHNFLNEFYTAFVKSKWIDGIREYSDTTMRLFSATGLFKFKNLPELSYREVLSVMFDTEQVRKSVFGEMPEEEFVQYEIAEESDYGKNSSISQIFRYSHDDIAAIAQKIERLLGVSDAAGVKALLRDRKNKAFIAHVNGKYPKDKIMELLPLFSDRGKDAHIKREVNDAATVPTIYEYIVGIAWYYISNKEFDLYTSLNLTLNADFEPVLHAGSGEGDIVIDYDDIIVMLEVTMMKKQAQKRGEWEPVLRHSLNLKAECEPREVITFFIADELDYNTINIWRAVAAAPLESTNTHQKVNSVIIMPFTNQQIFLFLEKGVSHRQIINEVKKSFQKVPKITDTKWHEDILSAFIK